jgi:hypothetical protein
MAWLLERPAGQKTGAGPQAADPIATGSLPVTAPAKDR